MRTLTHALLTYHQRIAEKDSIEQIARGKQKNVPKTLRQHRRACCVNEADANVKAPIPTFEPFEDTACMAA